MTDTNTNAKTATICGKTYPLKISSASPVLDGLRIGWAQIVAHVPEKGAYAYEAHLKIEGNHSQFGLVVSVKSTNPEKVGNCAFIHDSQLKELGADLDLGTCGHHAEGDPAIAMADKRQDLALIMGSWEHGEGNWDHGEYGDVGKARLLRKTGPFAGYTALCWLPRLLSARVAPVTVVDYSDGGDCEFAYVDPFDLKNLGVDLQRLAPEYASELEELEAMYD